VFSANRAEDSACEAEDPQESVVACTPTRGLSSRWGDENVLGLCRDAGVCAEVVPVPAVLVAVRPQSAFGWICGWIASGGVTAVPVTKLALGVERRS
jgi:hypothetical protein